MSTKPFDADTLIESGLASLAEAKRAIDELSRWVKEQPDADAAVTACVSIATLLLSRAPTDLLRDQTLARADLLLRFHYGLEIDDGGALERLAAASPDSTLSEDEIKALMDRLFDRFPLGQSVLEREDNGDG